MQLPPVRRPGAAPTRAPGPPCSSPLLQQATGLWGGAGWVPPPPCLPPPGAERLMSEGSPYLAFALACLSAAASHVYASPYAPRLLCAGDVVLTAASRFTPCTPTPCVCGARHGNGSAHACQGLTAGARAPAPAWHRLPCVHPPIPCSSTSVFDARPGGAPAAAAGAHLTRRPPTLGASAARARLGARFCDCSRPLVMNCDGSGSATGSNCRWPSMRHAGLRLRRVRPVPSAPARPCLPACAGSKPHNPLVALAPTSQHNPG